MKNLKAILKVLFHNWLIDKFIKGLNGIFMPYFSWSNLCSCESIKLYSIIIDSIAIHGYSLHLCYKEFTSMK